MKKIFWKALKKRLNPLNYEIGRPLTIRRNISGMIKDESGNGIIKEDFELQPKYIYTWSMMKRKKKKQKALNNVS